MYRIAGRGYIFVLLNANFGYCWLLHWLIFTNLSIEARKGMQNSRTREEFARNVRGCVSRFEERLDF